MMDYYRDYLSADRLRRAYDIAPPRVKRYLGEEVRHALSRLRSADRVLELGCGYGRVLAAIAATARCAVGIDTSIGSLVLARRELGRRPCIRLLAMDAAHLGFREGSFDRVVCVQNGISAFHRDQRRLVGEAIRVTRPGGAVLFSSYADAFWEDRLAWFRIQAGEGLIGEIDERLTGNGEIVCRDGFTATTVGPDRFGELAASVGATASIEEVDGSSIFCEIQVG
jgi:SAM-dependent methyltransferase